MSILIFQITFISQFCFNKNYQQKTGKISGKIEPFKSSAKRDRKNSIIFQAEQFYIIKILQKLDQTREKQNSEREFSISYF